MKKAIYFTFLMGCLSVGAQQVVCLAGGSASGKSTYAKKLKAEWGSKAVVLELDRYYVEHSGTLEEKKQFNWDHPSALDWDLLKEHLIGLKSGRSVQVPVRDFETFSRAKHTEQLDPAEIILFEGIHALHHPEIREVCHEMIFIDAPESVRLERRTKRDAVERNRTPEETRQVFFDTVKPMHDEFIEPVKNYPGVRVIRDEL